MTGRSGRYCSIDHRSPHPCSCERTAKL